ncbi:plasmid mobilization protein [Rivularia sp. UHCC 0363]|uniref:plasmid mobilization protein n=1 Tax=Rivularia sp. UHCC 0363 TaxID=3110244 RepID=UPI002B1E99CD|nr:hypothetical protein [Rivularia sp. UHCC 0363]MEA5596285.1 hypothetical protein [Rivularia sp. UHCC 0363]
MINKRDKQVKAYVTDEELVTIKERAKSVGLSQSEYITKKVLEPLPSTNRLDVPSSEQFQYLIDMMVKLTDKVDQQADQITGLTRMLEEQDEVLGTNGELTVGSFITGERHSKCIQGSILIMFSELPRDEQISLRDLDYTLDYSTKLHYLPELEVLVKTEYSQRKREYFKVVKMIPREIALPECPVVPTEIEVDPILPEILDTPVSPMLTKEELANQIADNSGELVSTILSNLDTIGGVKKPKLTKIPEYTNGYVPTDGTREQWQLANQDVQLEPVLSK